MEPLDTMMGLLILFIIGIIWIVAMILIFRIGYDAIIWALSV
jgi:hypothetical protein